MNDHIVFGRCIRSWGCTVVHEIINNPSSGPFLLAFIMNPIESSYVYSFDHCRWRPSCATEMTLGLLLSTFVLPRDPPHRCLHVFDPPSCFLLFFYVEITCDGIRNKPCMSLVFLCRCDSLGAVLLSLLLVCYAAWSTWWCVITNEESCFPLTDLLLHEHAFWWKSSKIQNAYWTMKTWMSCSIGTNGSTFCAKSECRERKTSRQGLLSDWLCSWWWPRTR